MDSIFEFVRMNLRWKPKSRYWQDTVFLCWYAAGGGAGEPRFDRRGIHRPSITARMVNDNGLCPLNRDNDANGTEGLRYQEGRGTHGSVKVPRSSVGRYAVALSRFRGRCF